MSLFNRNNGSSGTAYLSVLLALTLALLFSSGLTACGKKAPPEPLDSALEIERAKI
ncbi:MAG: hypothetical protein IME99_00470 [Proteobacteria bacterium]|nr:hypothetical protein [Pseudomonadota bacterium]